MHRKSRVGIAAVSQTISRAAQRAIMESMAGVTVPQKPKNVVIRPGLVEEELLRDVERHAYPLVMIWLSGSSHPAGRID